MDAHKGKRNILLYRLYVLFNEPLFWGPILIISLQNLAHMSLPSIYYMEAVVLGICVILDIPSGALADLIGRKKTIIVGRVFLFGSVFFFTTMTTPLHAWIGNILWAIGYSMQSGADTALLYDTLKEQGKEAEYKRIEGQAVGGRLVLVACCSLVTGLLASINLRLPLLIGLPFILVPLTAVSFLKEPVKTESYSVQKQLGVLKEGLTFIRHSVEVRWMVGFAALVATISKVWFFTYNPYFELVGLPIAYYGVVFFSLNVVAWLSSHYAYRIEHRLGEKKCIIGMVSCVGIPILLMGLLPIRAFVSLVVVQNVVRGFMRPFVGDYMNRHVTTNIRATMLSVQSSVANLTAIVGLATFGFFMEHLSLPKSLVILGITTLVFGAVSYASYKRRIA